MSHLEAIKKEINYQLCYLIIFALAKVIGLIIVYKLNFLRNVEVGIKKLRERE